MPICGKTFRQLSLKEELYTPDFAAVVFIAVPMVVMLIGAILLSRKATVPDSSQNFARIALLLTAWLYFWLNFAFFHFPWPWAEWTGRTPSGLIYTVCLIGLTLLALAWHGEHEPNKR